MSTEGKRRGVWAAVFAALAAAPLAGCLAPAPKAPVNWVVALDASGVSATERKWGVVKISRLEVRPPWDNRRVAVLRPDGSVEFDEANEFAAPPAALLRGAAVDALAASGAAELAAEATSAATAQRTLEITVTDFALDCRREGAKNAVVKLSAALLDGRSVAATAKAEASEPVAPSGDCGAAFSKAFSKAMSDAIKRL